MIIQSNRVKVNVVGTDPLTDFILGTPVGSFKAFPNGELVYTALADSGEWQVAIGTVSGLNLTRGIVQENSLGTLDQIDFAGKTLQIAQTISADYLNTIQTKLDTIEEGATIDQTGAEIKTLYEAEPDTNAFDNDSFNKLYGIEDGATADQDATEIKSLYESNLDTNVFTNNEQSKLLGIEENASIDQTSAEIKISYESNLDTNVFNNIEKSKLLGIEENATADQTDAEIKIAYENNLNTNAFSDIEQDKLLYIESNATVDQIAIEVPFTSTPDILSNNVQNAIETVYGKIANHTQEATTVVYDPTDDPTGSETDVQAALINHGKSIEQRVASCTGLSSGGKLTAVIGGTTFDVEAGVGQFFDSYSDPHNTSIIEQSWTAFTGIGISPESGTLSVAAIKVFIRTSFGNASIYKQVNVIDLELYRDHIFLGTVCVFNGVITDVIPSPSIIKQTATDAYDLLTNNIKVQDGHVFPVESALSVWQQSGIIFFPGINWYGTNHKNPNIFTFAETSPEPRQPILFNTITATGAIGGIDLTIIPKQYDDGNGVVDDLPSNKATIHRLYTIGFNDGKRVFVLEYGQTLYDSAEIAKGNLLIDDLNAPIEVENMYFIAYVCVSTGATNFGDASKAWIVSGEGGQTTSAAAQTVDHNNLVNREILDQHPIAAITGLTDGLLSKMNWRNTWFPGTYEINDVVKDGDWTMVANQQTTEIPSPQTIGDPYYIYSGTLTENSTTAKHIFFGQRYHWQAADIGYITGWRVYLELNQEYIIFFVVDPLGTPVVEELFTGKATSTGWTAFNIPPKLITEGSIFDVMVETDQPYLTPVTVTYNYNWENPNNAAIPGTGVISQATNLSSVLRVHKTDADGTDRTVQLSALTPGDIIDSGSVRYTILSIEDNGSYFSFSVSPTSLSVAGLVAVDFETVVAQAVKYQREVDYNLAKPNIEGMFIVDSNYKDIIPDNHQYGIDLEVQAASLSEHWDVLATSSAGNSSSASDGTAPIWGNIEGTLSSQTDLQTALDNKEPIVSPKNSGFNKDFGSASNTVCQGDDVRLSNDRNPTTHNHDSLYYTKDIVNSLHAKSLKTISETPPLDPEDGQEWMNSSNNRQYTWYAGDSAGDWVQE